MQSEAKHLKTTAMNNKHCPEGSKFFKEVIFPRKASTDGQGTGNVKFVVHCPQIRPDQRLAVTGDAPCFDGWRRSIPLCDESFPTWTLSIEASSAFEFKFVIIDPQGHILQWEKGYNHRLDPTGNVLVDNVTPEFDFESWRGAGVAVPVFSLRSESGFGVGEFADIKKLVDWAVATGQKIIQLLPVNDTTMSGSWRDSYPYNANSTIALHPQYLNLPAAGIRQTKAYKSLQAELNALPAEDYERVNKEKERLLRRYYNRNYTAIIESPYVREFFIKNTRWLPDYAVWSCLRDENGTSDHSSWGEYAEYSQRKASEYFSDHRVQAWYYVFVQYCLDKQLRDAVEYAHAHGVGLKGDLPIGVSRDSVDAWSHPELFNMDSQTGAPPDFFSEDGQNWGFPTYNWPMMAKDGFAWWKERLSKMSEYFDAFRIDHVLGFFRIWEIPIEYRSGILGHFSPAMPYTMKELEARGFTKAIIREKGKSREDCLFIREPRRRGYWHPRINARNTSVYAKLTDGLKAEFDTLHEDFFYHRHNRFWKDSALSKLPPLLDSTDMMVCAEDLGMIPACVPEVMKTLGMLSLDIQRMPKVYGEEFAHTERYPYLSVCTTGSHDTSTLRGWWTENKEATQRYYNSVLGREGEAPAECTPEIAAEILKNHLASPAMLAILPLQDWLATDSAVRYQGALEDERINVPADPCNYWHYRMHLTLEALLAAEDFNCRLRQLISASGR